MEGPELIAIGLYVAIKSFISYICFRKGKPVFGALGLISIPIPLFIGWFAVVGAIRLAKPSSRWALDRYDPHKMAAARHRFPEDEALAQTATRSWGLESPSVTSEDPRGSQARVPQTLEGRAPTQPLAQKGSGRSHEPRSIGRLHIAWAVGAIGLALVIGAIAWLVATNTANAAIDDALNAAEESRDETKALQTEVAVLQEEADTLSNENRNLEAALSEAKSANDGAVIRYCRDIVETNGLRPRDVDWYAYLVSLLQETRGGELAAVSLDPTEANGVCTFMINESVIEQR